ncbi:Glycosyl hydrolase family 30 protein [Globisporangium polare]
MLVVRPFALSVAVALLAAAQWLLVAESAATATPQRCSSFSTRFNQNIEGVCVCTTTDCDSISNGYLTLDANELGIYQTSKAGDRLAYSTAPTQSGHDAEADLVIGTTTRYQKIIGFGGAFTDSAAINVGLMDASVQQKIVDAYFSETGLQYTTGRVPIASTDFSEKIFSYNPVVDDLNMEHFSIDVDRSPQSFKLELIKRAIQATRVAQRDLALFASSWAPPAWMTTENTTINGVFKGEPGGPYWKALALYYSNFLDAYEAEGVRFWAVTTQNEPIQQKPAPKYWQSLRFNTTTERDFIKKDLGPLMKQRHPELKLIIMDDQKDALAK